MDAPALTTPDSVNLLPEPRTQPNSTASSSRFETVVLIKLPSERSFGLTLLQQVNVQPTDYPTTSSLFANAPAARAGVKTGWTIRAVNGEDCAGQSIRDVASKFRDVNEVVLLVDKSTGDLPTEPPTPPPPSTLPPPPTTTQMQGPRHTDIDQQDVMASAPTASAMQMKPEQSLGVHTQPLPPPPPPANGVVVTSAPFLPSLPHHAVPVAPPVASQAVPSVPSSMPQPSAMAVAVTPPSYSATQIYSHPIVKSTANAPVQPPVYSQPMVNHAQVPPTRVVDPPQQQPVSVMRSDHSPPPPRQVSQSPSVVSTSQSIVQAPRPPPPPYTAPAPLIPASTTTTNQPRPPVETNHIDSARALPPTRTITTPTPTPPKPTPTPPTPTLTMPALSAATQTPMPTRQPQQESRPTPSPHTNLPTPTLPASSPPPQPNAQRPSAGKKRGRAELDRTAAVASAEAAPANAPKKRGRPPKRKPAPTVAEYWDSDDAMFFTGSDDDVEEVAPPNHRRQSSRNAESGGRARRSLTVSRLMTMGFSQEDAEASVVVCGQDPDKCMLWIVAHIEERQFLNDLNKASIESEQQKRLDAQEQKKIENETLQQTTTFTSLFTTSYILSDEAEARRLHDLLAHTMGSISSDTLMRTLFTKLLTVEGKAIRWYKQATRCYMLQLAARLEAAFAGHDVLHCCARATNTQASSDACAFVRALHDEEQALTRALFSMPENHGGVPLAFLHADESMQFDLDEDGFEVVEVPPPSPKQ